MFDVMDTALDPSTGFDDVDDEWLWTLTHESGHASPDVASHPGLAEMAPGPMLAAVLGSIDVETLSGHDRVIVMAAHQRMASHYQAQVYSSMASVADAVGDALASDGELDPELHEDAAASEVRAALRLTRRAADAELDIALRYQTRLPEVLDALRAGIIDRRRANLIVHRTDHLPGDTARGLARRALERAPELTTGQLTSLLRKLAVEADPEEAKQRYRAAVDGRRVVLEAGHDGTADLHLLDVPPDRAARIRGRLDAIARSLRRNGEPRTMDQLRADAALDLLDPANETSHGGVPGSVVLTVDLATLAGLSDSPGDVGGYGPVIADISRKLAIDIERGEWRFVVTDGSGHPVTSGTTRRRPNAAETRDVQTSHPRCVFPGCRIPAFQCDLDHITPWSDAGPTSVENLAPLCRHDHRMRHRTGWSYRRTTEGGHEWVSPLGHRYTTSGRSP